MSTNYGFFDKTLTVKKEEKVSTSSNPLISVKLIHNRETRRFQIHRRVTFEALLKQIKEIFPQIGAFVLKYADEDGDAVTLETDAELQEALAFGATQNALKLITYPCDGSTPGVLASSPVVVSLPIPTPTTPTTPVELKVEADEKEMAQMDKAARREFKFREKMERQAKMFEDLVPMIVNGVITGLQQQQQTPAQVSVKEPAPSSSSKPIHPFVTCDGCQRSIAGVRYKCAHCPDFDFCEECEASVPHDAGHLFIKVKHPVGSGYFPTTPVLPAHRAHHHAHAHARRHGGHREIVVDIPASFLIQDAPKEGPKKEAPRSVYREVAASLRKEVKQGFVNQLRASFVADVTLPDGAVVEPGTTVTKKWKLKNSGQNAWPADTSACFTYGNLGERDNSVHVGAVQPGETCVVETSFVIPEKRGRLYSCWMLRSQGSPFGHRFWCDLVIANPTPTAGVVPEPVTTLVETVVPKPTPVTTPCLLTPLIESPVLSSVVPLDPVPAPLMVQTPEIEHDFDDDDDDDYTSIDDEFVVVVADRVSETTPSAPTIPEPSVAFNEETVPHSTPVDIPETKPTPAIPVSTTTVSTTTTAPLTTTVSAPIPVPQPPVSSSTTTTTTTSVHSTLEDECMKQLFDMGFCNRDRNRSLLNKYKFNVSAVANELLADADAYWDQRRHF